MNLVNYRLPVLIFILASFVLFSVFSFAVDSEGEIVYFDEINLSIGLLQLGDESFGCDAADPTCQSLVLNIGESGKVDLIIPITGVKTDGGPLNVYMSTEAAAPTRNDSIDLESCGSRWTLDCGEEYTFGTDLKAGTNLICSQTGGLDAVMKIKIKDWDGTTFYVYVNQDKVLDSKCKNDAGQASYNEINREAASIPIRTEDLPADVAKALNADGGYVINPIVIEPGTSPEVSEECDSVAVMKALLDRKVFALLLGDEAKIRVVTSEISGFIAACDAERRVITEWQGGVTLSEEYCDATYADLEVAYSDLDATNNRDKIVNAIRCYALAYGVPPELAVGIASAESSLGTHPTGNSSASCKGIMQLCDAKEHCANGTVLVQRTADGEPEKLITDAESTNTDWTVNNQRLNIKCGVAWIKYKYGAQTECDEGGEKTYCGSETDTSLKRVYSGWSCAVRGYHGWSCTSEYADSCYLSKVKSKCIFYAEIYDFLNIGNCDKIECADDVDLSSCAGRTTPSSGGKFC